MQIIEVREEFLINEVPEKVVKISHKNPKRKKRIEQKDK
jgi:hypothetical protein